MVADPISVATVAAAVWLVGRLRADAEDALWSRLKRLVWGDPLVAALEGVTAEALRETVRSDLADERLDDEMVDRVVEVLGELWSRAPVSEAAGGSLFARVVELAGEAMGAATAPVEGLGGDRGGVSSLSVLERDYGLAVDPDGFALAFGSRWARALVRAARADTEVLGQLSNELNAELVRGRIDATRDEIVAKLSGVATAGQVDEQFGRLGEQLDAHLDEVARALQVWQETQYARLSLKPPVAELDWQPGDPAAELLRPAYALVPYVGRERLREAIADWCATAEVDGPPVDVWFVTGGGGFGKTRLGIEVCRLAEQRGWTAGLLDPDVRPGADAALDALAGWPAQLLVVIDYAESRPATLKGLVKRLQRAGPGQLQVRVVALVRRRMTRDELVEHFDVHADAEQTAEADVVRLTDAPVARQALVDEFNQSPRDEAFRTLLGQATLSRLDEDPDGVDRLALFRAAHSSLAELLRRPPLDPAGRPPTLTAAHFARPLYVLAAAYLVAAGDEVDIDTLSETELLETLLREHEADHWDRMFKRGLEAEQWTGALHPDDQWTAVGLATLLGATDHTEAITIARLVPHLNQDQIPKVARWLATLYPNWSTRTRDQQVHPVEPDRLGEVLVTDVLTGHPGLLADALAVSSSQQRVRLFTVVSRAAAHATDLRGQLRGLLDEHFGDLLDQALSENQELLVPLMAAFDLTQPPHGALDATKRLPERLPTGLVGLAAQITATATLGVQANRHEGSDQQAEQALLLNALAARLVGAGRGEEALATIEEAVGHYRELTDTNRAAHLPDLARALSNLAALLGEVGRGEEALTAAEEAVGYCRELTDTNRAVHLPDLARALNNLALQLSEVGRGEEALATIEEAVGHYRELTDTNRAAHLPNLAKALSNLAKLLGEMGRDEEALTAAEEAVGYCRELTDTNRAAHLPDLARALSNLVLRLAGAGRREDALTAAEEAVGYCRELTDTNRAAHLPDLARALNNLALQLGEMGRGEEAVTAAEEAVGYCRELTDTNRAAHLPDLAKALSNLAKLLGEVGRDEEALTAAEEAVGHYWELTDTNRAAHLPDLARAVLNLAVQLAGTRRGEEALATIEEAVGHYRELTDTNRAAHLPNLARAVLNLAVQLAGTRRGEEALATIEEAVGYCRELTDTNRAAHLPDLARALNNLVLRLAGAGRREEALATAEEAVGHYWELTRTNPAAHLPALAASLNSLAVQLAGVGRGEEALATIEEAVGYYQKLARTNQGVYLPALAASLTYLALLLGEVGRGEEIEARFEDMLTDLGNTLLGEGHLRLTRGRWRHRTGHAHAVADIRAAIEAFTAARDRYHRAQARSALRDLRDVDPRAFDHDWDTEQTPLPVWLAHLTVDQPIVDELVAWVQAPDGDTSRTHLQNHASVLLIDQAQAGLEHLIDANPLTDTLYEHLALLQAARIHGIDAAYDAHAQGRQQQRQLLLLLTWIATRSWADSRALATEYHEQLTDESTRELLHALADHNPTNRDFQLYRGLIELLTTGNTDTAYQLLHNPKARTTALDEAEAGSNHHRALALARIGVATEPDNQEAHYRHVVAALQTGNLTEAQEATDACKSHAAPYEITDNANRLQTLATQHTRIAQAATTLAHHLSTNHQTPDTDHPPSPDPPLRT